MNDYSEQTWYYLPSDLAPAWLAALTAWQPYTAAEQRALGPRLLRGNLDIATEPADTFFDYDCFFLLVGNKCHQIFWKNNTCSKIT